MYSNVVSSCQFLLENYPQADNCRYYLNSRLSKKSQELFQFGYFPEDDHIHALFSYIDETTLSDLKLAYSKYIEDALYPRTIIYSYFENYPLILPYKNQYGQIIALVGRTLLSEDDRKIKKIAKYKNTIFNKGNFLFGLYEAKSSIIKNDNVYIVEGQFDVIKAVENNIQNIIALGCSSMTAYQFSTILRYTNNITLILDNDEAGEKGRKSILKKYNKFANIKNIYIPEPYKDIDEYLSNNSSLDFLNI